MIKLNRSCVLHNKQKFCNPGSIEASVTTQLQQPISFSKTQQLPATSDNQQPLQTVPREYQVVVRINYQ